MNDFKNIELTNDEIITALSRRVSRKYENKYIGLIVVIVMIIIVTAIFLTGLWYWQMLIGCFVIIPLFTIIFKMWEKERDEIKQLLKGIDETE